MLFRYGIDAPHTVRNYFCYFLCVVAVCTVYCKYAPSYLNVFVYYYGLFSLWCLALCLLYPVVAILYGSAVAKFRERDWLFDTLQLRDSDVVLDVGCGRGLLLVEAAKRLAKGKVYGVDIWASADQSGNCEEYTIANATEAGVRSRVEVVSADMREMPFADAFFDVIVSSWAIHNIEEEAERRKALAEIHRCLKPAGKIAILDISCTEEYLRYFRDLGYEARLLGPRYTFGIPAHLLYAQKP